MVDKIVVTITDLAKKHPGKPAYIGLYSLVKHVYQDDGQGATELPPKNKSKIIKYQGNFKSKV